MVEHPVSVEFDENSCDIELALNVTEESNPTASNGVTQKKKSRDFESLPTIDGNTIESSNNDLSINSKIIESVMEEEELDFLDAETTCDQVSQSCCTTSALETDNNTDKTDSSEVENHVSDSCTKVNGFSSKGSSDDDISQDKCCSENPEKSKCSLRKFLTNGSLKDLWPSKSEKLDRLTEGQNLVPEEVEKCISDVPIVDSCDKSIHHSSNGCRVNGDIPEFPDDGSVSPGAFKRKLDTDLDDSDSGSRDSSSCPKKRPKIDHSGVSSSCPEESSKIDDVIVPNGYSDSENSINPAAADGFHPRNKPTARKSTGGNVAKIITRPTEEDCAQEALADTEELFIALENGDDDATADFVDESAPSDERPKSPVGGKVEEEKGPILITPESVSNEMVKDMCKKMLKTLSRRELEEMLLQVYCETMSESGPIGELKKRSSERETAENFKKSKLSYLEKQVYQMNVMAELFSAKASQLKENDQIPIPTIVNRSVGLQVNLSSSFEPISPATRTSSVDDGDQTGPSTVMNGRISSSEAGQSSSCSSPTKSPRSSFSEIATTQKSSKPSLPPDNNSAVDNKKNNTLPPKKNPPSETPSKEPSAASDDVVDLTELDDNIEIPPRPLSTAPRKRFPYPAPRRPSELAVSPKHPAPLPPTPKGRIISNAKLPPPKPNLSIQKNNLAIQMTWDLNFDAEYEPIDKYQIWAYQETAGVPISITLWKLVGDVESLDLPMACTLTQFVNGFTYHFAVRAVDKHGRYGPFSCARSIAL